MTVANSLVLDASLSPLATSASTVSRRTSLTPTQSLSNFLPAFSTSQSTNQREEREPLQVETWTPFSSTPTTLLGRDLTIAIFIYFLPKLKVLVTGIFLILITESSRYAIFFLSSYLLSQSTHYHSLHLLSQSCYVCFYIVGYCTAIIHLNVKKSSGKRALLKKCSTNLNYN